MKHESSAPGFDGFCDNSDVGVLSDPRGYRWLVFSLYAVFLLSVIGLLWFAGIHNALAASGFSPTTITDDSTSVSFTTDSGERAFVFPDSTGWDSGVNLGANSDNHVEGPSTYTGSWSSVIYPGSSGTYYVVYCTNGGGYCGSNVSISDFRSDPHYLRDVEICYGGSCGGGGGGGATTTASSSVSVFDSGAVGQISIFFLGALVFFLAAFGFTIFVWRHFLP